MDHLGLMLNNPYGVQYLRSFLAKEYATENIDFWNAVKMFKNMNSQGSFGVLIVVVTQLDMDNVNASALSIFNTFIEKDAPNQINLPSHVTQKIVQQVLPIKTNNSPPPLSPRQIPTDILTEKDKKKEKKKKDLKKSTKIQLLDKPPREYKRESHSNDDADHSSSPPNSVREEGGSNISGSSTPRGTSELTLGGDPTSTSTSELVEIHSPGSESPLSLSTQSRSRVPPSPRRGSTLDPMSTSSPSIHNSTTPPSSSPRLYASLPSSPNSGPLSTIADSSPAISKGSLSLSSPDNNNNITTTISNPPTSNPTISNPTIQLIYDEAVQSVFVLMQKDSFRRFTKSDFGHQLKRRYSILICSSE